MQRSLFNATGYMVAALVLVANSAAVGMEAIDVEIESNSVVGFVLLCAGVVAATYVLAGVLGGPLVTWWRERSQYGPFGP